MNACSLKAKLTININSGLKVRRQAFEYLKMWGGCKANSANPPLWRGVTVREFSARLCFY